MATKKTSLVKSVLSTIVGFGSSMVRVALIVAIALVVIMAMVIFKTPEVEEPVVGANSAESATRINDRLVMIDGDIYKLADDLEVVTALHPEISAVEAQMAAYDAMVNRYADVIDILARTPYVQVDDSHAIVFGTLVVKSGETDKTVEYKNPQSEGLPPR